MNRPRLGWTALIAGIIGAFYALDSSLVHIETAELHKEAHGLYLQGEALLADGRAAEAVQPLQRAHTLERKNRTYQLAYAEVLTAAGFLDEAGDVLNQVIGQAPNDGRANLLLARLAKSRNSIVDEAPYYHRAIYGVWDRNGQNYANQARLEWIEELARRGDRKMLLGELLPLEAATEDREVLAKIAHGYLAAGSPSRSADLYRRLLAADPDNAVLEQGLGEAETAEGRFTEAQKAFLRAFRKHPEDPSIRHRMELSGALSAIDPTPRRLPSQEKYERSLRILKLVTDAATACGVQFLPENKPLTRRRADFSNEAAEQVLHQAESLWTQRPPGCPEPELLPPLMSKLLQP